MLSIENVAAGYGLTTCLKDISLSVHPGEIVALLGANGAGKSTLLMAVSGLVPIRQGAIRFQGTRIDLMQPEAISALGIGHVPEGRRVFARLTVLENLELGAYAQSRRGQVAEDVDRAFELFPVLRDRRRQLAGTLSGGEQQMLAIARGLMSRPTLLLLDEPSLGLAPKMVQVVFQTLERIHKTGTTILLVEQNARMALDIAQRGYILETGSITMADAATSLANNPQVKAAYLGG